MDSFASVTQPAPVQLDHAAGTQALTRLTMTARVIRANGEVEELGQIAEWEPPLAVRIGKAIQRFIERVQSVWAAFKRLF